MFIGPERALSTLYAAVYRIKKTSLIQYCNWANFKCKPWLNLACSVRKVLQLLGLSPYLLPGQSPRTQLHPRPAPPLRKFSGHACQIYRCSMYYVRRKKRLSLPVARPRSSFSLSTLPQSDLRPRLGFATKRVAV